MGIQQVYRSIVVTPRSRSVALTPHVSRYAFCSNSEGSFSNSSSELRDSRHEREIRTRIERRIDVDEIDLAGELGRGARAGHTSCRPR